MNMQNLNGKRVVITGGSQGLGLAMVEALAACGANVIAISRDRSNLSSAEHAGATVIAGDATDATLMNKVVREEAPDVLILNAGARLPVKPIDQQSWDEFSIVWNTDVKAGLVGIQAALNTPMKRGGRVLVMSSGAAMVLAVPFIKPDDLGHKVAAACAEIEGVSIEELVMQRYGSILRPAQIGEQVAEILVNPRYLQGVAYGFRNDCDLQPLDV
jgi:NAD(P)-dependent dehydrogenase (short-subunit alcohol dehydrogenase family)